MRILTETALVGPISGRQDPAIAHGGGAGAAGAHGATGIHRRDRALQGRSGAEATQRGVPGPGALGGGQPVQGATYALSAFDLECEPGCRVVRIPQQMPRAGCCCQQSF